VKSTNKESGINALYETPLGATRSGPLYNAHWYPTKISPESIALMIACHTKPGDLIFDGFGGSCTTALAALLCAKPSDQLRAIAKTRGLSPSWGPRRAIVYEITGLGSFIGQTFTSQPDPIAFASAAMRLINEAERRYGWLYQTLDEHGAPALARHFIWSELLECTYCHSEVPLWDACVKLKPAKIASRWKCPECGKAADVTATPRVSEQRFDDILQTTLKSKARRLARVDGITARRHWTRQPSDRDLELVARIEGEPIPPTVPIVPMMGKGGACWGDLWRAGYHEGITHVHHFYTRRNLIALGGLYELVENEPKPIRDALRFWISSYNSSHSTLMTRVVAKQNQPELVLTSSQPGVLYISGLPVEKNVFHGLKRKIKTIRDAFAVIHGLEGKVEVRQASSIQTNLDAGSVDYVFTDPPFGGNIPYSEVNFISEAWLGRSTCNRDEAVVSSAQSKGIEAYETLLTKAFLEMRRILKPSGRATVVFHSTQSDVWRALTQAYSAAGFGVELSNILDKKQGSFKQVTTINSAKGDPMLLLSPMVFDHLVDATKPLILIEQLLSEADAAADPQERLPQRIYSRFVGHYLRRHSSPPLDADEFYAKLALARQRG
jgi:hypothetical protein